MNKEIDTGNVHMTIVHSQISDFLLKNNILTISFHYNNFKSLAAR